ncbi:MAG: hypothetical protein KIT16_09805 [Rhodospirillaceae bacterium]|nr:hypothetical protein [Rhodospirillaceae bacterium]
MARSDRPRTEEARRRAEDRFTKLQHREDEARKAFEDLAKVQQAEALKTARLRELRLAKEAADQAAASRAAAEKAAAAEAAQARKMALRRAKTVKA